MKSGETITVVNDILIAFIARKQFFAATQFQEYGLKQHSEILYVFHIKLV